MNYKFSKPKSLLWESFKAKSVFGDFRIEEIRGEFYLFCGNKLVCGYKGQSNNMLGAYKNEKFAIEAAQTHFEKLVNSCLEFVDS